MKVIVCGGRDYGDREAVFAALDKAHAKRPLALVVHSTSAVGRAAEQWSAARGVLSGAVVSGDPMATSPDGVVAFPGAPASLLEKAREAGVKVWCPYGEGE